MRRRRWENRSERRMHGNGNEDESESPATSRRRPDSRAASSDRTPRGAGRSSCGLEFERYFTAPGVDPFDAVEWEPRDAVIGNEKGETVFEQKDVEVPKFWSQTATNVVVPKYFRGQLGTPERETLGAPADRPGRRHDDRLGQEGRLLRHRGGRRDLPRRAHAPPAATRMPASTRRSGSTSASRSSRSARPASSTRSRTPWSRSSTSPRPRPCSSSSARAPARTSRRCARRARSSPAAAPPRARSRSCGASTPSPAWSRAAARPAAPPRWSILNVEHPDIVEFIACKANEEKKARALIDAGYEAASTSRRRLQLDHLPERQPLGARHRRLHAGGRSRTATGRPAGCTDGRPMADLSGPRPDAHDRRVDLGLRRSRACSTTRRSTAGTPARTRRGSTPRIRAPSTCSSTTRPATWRAQPDEVPRRRRRVRRRALPPACRALDHRPGDPGRPRQLSDARRSPTNRHDFRPLGLGYSNLGAC